MYCMILTRHKFTVYKRGGTEEKYSARVKRAGESRKYEIECVETLDVG
jgi:hypothetical protein